MNMGGMVVEGGGWVEVVRGQQRPLVLDAFGAGRAGLRRPRRVGGARAQRRTGCAHGTLGPRGVARRARVRAGGARAMRGAYGAGRRRAPALRRRTVEMGPPLLMRAVHPPRRPQERRPLVFLGRRAKSSTLADHPCSSDTGLEPTQELIESMVVALAPVSATRRAGRLSHACASIVGGARNELRQAPRPPTATLGARDFCWGGVTAARSRAIGGGRERPEIRGEGRPKSRPEAGATGSDLQREFRRRLVRGDRL